MADERKQKLSKQQRLPPLQTAEALASLIWLWLEANGHLTERLATFENRRVHVQNVVDWVVANHALGEGDVIPF